MNRNFLCKVCQSDKVKSYCHINEIEYFLCKECQSIFLPVVPTQEAMLEYAEKAYKNGLYVDYVNAKNIKRLHFESRIKLLKERFPDGKLLDVGCACGHFLNVALKNGYDSYGVEFSKNAIDAADCNVQKRIINGSVNDLSKYDLGQFDIVTAFDIIEHVDDPYKFVGDIRRIMKDKSGLIISTPDTGHFLRYVMGRGWPMLQPLQHTVLFSKKSMRFFLKKLGFQDIIITSASKVVTINYLFEQLIEYNPFLYNFYKRSLAKVLPQKILNTPLGVNIGEMLAIATK